MSLAPDEMQGLYVAAHRSIVDAFLAFTCVDTRDRRALWLLAAIEVGRSAEALVANVLASPDADPDQRLAASLSDARGSIEAVKHRLWAVIDDHDARSTAPTGE